MGSHRQSRSCRVGGLSNGGRQQGGTTDGLRLDDEAVTGSLLAEGAWLVLPGRFDCGGQHRPSVLGWIHQLDGDLGLSAGDVPRAEHLALQPHFQRRALLQVALSSDGHGMDDDRRTEALPVPCTFRGDNMILSSSAVSDWSCEKVSSQTIDEK